MLVPIDNILINTNHVVSVKTTGPHSCKVVFTKENSALDLNVSLKEVMTILRDPRSYLESHRMEG